MIITGCATQWVRSRRVIVQVSRSAQIMPAPAR
jgi:hypothetical protein